MSETVRVRNKNTGEIKLFDSLITADCFERDNYKLGWYMLECESCSQPNCQCILVGDKKIPYWELEQ